jgi:ADP-ribose pyrophosphatase YjhB (NUDIX family)
VVHGVVVEPAPRLVEHHCDGGGWSATWLDPPFCPPTEFVDQVYGICFDSGGRVLLVAVDMGDGSTYWNLPGGGLEPGESLAACLVREVAEEACARVVASRYLGCQRVEREPQQPTEEARVFYQVRFWARVELDEWNPAFETCQRRLVMPDQFLSTLTWGSAATAGIILDEGLRLDAAAGRRA